MELGEILKYKKGKAPNSNRVGNDFVTYLSPEYLRNKATATLIPDFLGKFEVNENDLLLLWDGSNAGEFFVAKKGILSSTMVKLLFDEERIDKSFFYYQLKFIEDFLKSQTNGSGIPHVDKEILLSIKIEEFLKSEQRQIATILSKVDEAISQTEKLIAKYSRIKTGLMQDLLTKGIDEHGNIRSEATHQFKDSPLGRIPVEWEVEKLSKLAKVSRGRFTPRPRNNPIYYGGNFPFIQTGDISNCKELFLDNYTQTLNEKGILVSKKFSAGTIVMTIAANIGDTAILKREMYLTDSIVGIQTKLKEIYLELFFKSIKVQLENTATQSAQKNINVEKLNEILVKYPININEQERIEERYLSIGSVVKRLEAQLSKLLSIKSGLMQDLLSGKVRVNHLINETATA